MSTPWQIVSVGAVCGLGGVNTVPTTGYQVAVIPAAARSPCSQGFGYVASVGDGSFLRFYFSSIQPDPYSISSTIPGHGLPRHVSPQYSTQACRSPSTAHTAQAQNASSGFVGCAAGAVQPPAAVAVWWRPISSAAAMAAAAVVAGGYGMDKTSPGGASGTW